MTCQKVEKTDPLIRIARALEHISSSLASIDGKLGLMMITESDVTGKRRWATLRMLDVGD